MIADLREATAALFACRRCHLAQPITEYYPTRSMKRGYRSECRTCNNRRQAVGVRPCIVCGGEMPRHRKSEAHSACSRDCLLVSIGLPVDFDAVRDLDQATAVQVRDTLNAIILAVRGRAPA